MKSLDTGNPLISVIMPTYNHAKFIGKAIESVLNQTYKNLELIIIDNYSEDDTEKIVASYKDDRIIYLKFRNNGIIAASRNHGIKHSNGVYIAFLDSDDLWDNNKLAMQLAFMREHNLNFCSTLTRYISSNDSALKKTIPEKIVDEILSPGTSSIRHLIRRNFIDLSSALVERQFLGAFLFDEDPLLVAAEDLFLWLELFYRKTCKFKLLKKELVSYRVLDNSAINRHNKTKHRAKKEYCLSKFALKYTDKRILSEINKLSGVKYLKRKFFG